MRRQALLAIALAALIALAGCSTILDGDDPTENDTELPTDEPTPDELDVEYPDGYNASGVTNASLATDTHLAAVEASESWVLVYDAQFSNTEQAVNVTETRTVDLSGDESRELIEVEADQAQQTTYANDTDTYRRTTVGDQSFYAYQKAGMQTISATYSDMFLVFLNSVDFEHESTTEEDGETLIVYEGTDLTEGNELEGEQVNQTVDDVDATLILDEQGRIHEFTFAGTVNQETATNDVQFAVTLSDFGTTTLEEPDWLDDAKESTLPQDDVPEEAPENETDQ